MFSAFVSMTCFHLDPVIFIYVSKIIIIFFFYLYFITTSLTFHLVFPFSLLFNLYLQGILLAGWGRVSFLIRRVLITWKSYTVMSSTAQKCQ